MSLYVTVVFLEVRAFGAASSRGFEVLGSWKPAEPLNPGIPKIIFPTSTIGQPLKIMLWKDLGLFGIYTDLEKQKMIPRRLFSEVQK